jgi:small-conductance mechanosensitive channel
MTLLSILPNWYEGKIFLGVPILDWCLAVIVACISFLAMLTARKIAIGHLRKRLNTNQKKYPQTLIELLSATNWLLLGVIASITGIEILNLSDHWNTIVSHLWFIAFALQFGLWFNRAAAIWQRDHLFKRSATNTVMATLTTTFVRVVIWIIVILAILENASVNITALVASLGVGGVAIALALQTILGDLFAAISIAVDKPFQVGDVITAGDTTGSVERIGLKSTHIRSISGEQIVCSNTELLKRTIQNFKRMTERRVVFRFNLSYLTPVEIAEQIPESIKDIICSMDGTNFGRAHLVKLGNASMEFEVVYIVQDSDYQRYMDIQQFINVSILRKLAELGADIALPDGHRATFSRKISNQEDVVPSNKTSRVAH